MTQPLPTALDQLLLKTVAVAGVPFPSRQVLNVVSGATGVDNPNFTVDGQIVGSTDLTLTAAPITSFNVKTYGATGNGITDDTSFILLAIAAAVTAGAGLVVFPQGTYKVSTLTLQAGLLYQFQPGASILPTGVATFGGTILADPAQAIFGGSGSVGFVAGSQLCVYPDWWSTPVTSTACPLQAACNAATGVGIQVTLLNKTYLLCTGSVGLTLLNDNTRVVGVAESRDDTSTQPSAGGPQLSYSGTGTPILCGPQAYPPSTFMSNLRLENFRVVNAANGNSVSLQVTNVNLGYFFRLRFTFPNPATTNTGILLQDCVSCKFESCTVHGGVTGYGGATGVSVIFPYPTTTTVFEDCYFHYCSLCVHVDTSFAKFRNCVFESSQRAVYVTNGEVYCNDCWWENTGDSGIYANDAGQFTESVCYITSTGRITITNPHVQMYIGQNVLFQVQTTGVVKVHGGTCIAASYPVAVTAVANTTPIQITVASPLNIGASNTLFYAVVSEVNTNANGIHQLEYVSPGVYSLLGTTAGGTSLGATPTVSVIPYIDYPGPETKATFVELDDVWLDTGTGVPFYCQPPSDLANTGDVLTWQQQAFPKLQTRTYQWVQKSVAASVSSGDMATASGYYDNSFTMPEAGYILGITVYASKTLTGGTILTQVYDRTQSNTIMVQLSAASSLPQSVDRGVFSAPVAKGDVIACNYQTSSGFAPAGSGTDVVVELLVGFGSVTS